NTGIVMGTVDYMAPEQAVNTRTAGARSDIYSLGCTFYYWVTGSVMFEGETAIEKILAHREHAIPNLRSRIPGIPNEVVGLFKKMVAKRPEDRFQTMTEVTTSLESLLTKFNI